MALVPSEIKTFSDRTSKIHRKTLIPGDFFDKVAGCKSGYTLSK